MKEANIFKLIDENTSKRHRLIEERDLIDIQINNLLSMRGAINRRLEAIGINNLELIRLNVRDNRRRDK